MQNADAPAESATAPVAAGRRRLGVRVRRAVLVGHIAAAGAWLGVDVAMAVLIVSAAVTDDPITRATSLSVLGTVAVWPLLTCGVLCLVTGVVLGLGSRWGVLRYWWVAAKLAINVILTALVVVSLRSELVGQAQQARRALAGETVTFDLSNLVYPPTVSPALLLTAMVLSVVKPWGRISGRRSTRGGPGPTRSRSPRAGRGRERRAWPSSG